MKEYMVEDDKLDLYKNGVCTFRQDTPAYGVGAFPHVHTAIEIIYVTDGSMVVEVDDVKYNVFAGDLVLFRSNTIHHILTQEKELNRYYVAKVRPEIIFDLAEEKNHGAYALYFTVNSADSRCLWTREEVLNNPCMKQGVDMLVSLVEHNHNQGDLMAKLGVGLLLMGMLENVEISGAGSVNSDTASGVYRAMSYINRHYSEDITEGQMSELAGMSCSHFSRSFKAVTGKNFKEYLNIARINMAEHMLATTDKTVTMICAECGFNSAAYFIKTFKKCKYMTPMEYKRRKKYNEYTKSERIRYGWSQQTVGAGVDGTSQGQT